MAFDDLFPKPDEEDDVLPDDDEEEGRFPAWLAPPDDDLGVVIGGGLVVARNDRAAVALEFVIAHREGVSLRIRACGRGLRRSQVQALFHQHGFWDGDDVPPEVLRVGVELADGRRASNTLRTPWDQQPDGPILTGRGGGSGGGSGRQITLSQDLWLWPLPPEGLLRLYVEWPALDLPLSHTDLDATAIRIAAAAVTSIWAD